MSKGERPSSKGYLHPQTAQELEAVRAQLEQYEKRLGGDHPETQRIYEELGALEVQAYNQLLDHRN